MLGVARFNMAEDERGPQRPRPHLKVATPLELLEPLGALTGR
jgi:hypothetical protein